jgi:hypothetical protein
MLAVFPDGAVRGKPAQAGHVEDGHPGPALLVPEGSVHLTLAINVGLVVGQDQILIMVKERGHQGLKKPGVAAGKVTGADEIDYLPQLIIAFVIRQRLVTPGLAIDISGASAEEEEIFRPRPASPH